MKPLPLGIGTIHFVGIGGIGMSGIAEILHTQGYAVAPTSSACAAWASKSRSATRPGTSRARRSSSSRRR